MHQLEHENSRLGATKNFFMVELIKHQFPEDVRKSLLLEVFMTLGKVLSSQIFEQQSSFELGITLGSP